MTTAVLCCMQQVNTAVIARQYTSTTTRQPLCAAQDHQVILPLYFKNYYRIPIKYEVGGGTFTYRQTQDLRHEYIYGLGRKLSLHIQTNTVTQYMWALRKNNWQQFGPKTVEVGAPHKNLPSPGLGKTLKLNLNATWHCYSKSYLTNSINVIVAHINITNMHLLFCMFILSARSAPEATTNGFV